MTADTMEETVWGVPRSVWDAASEEERNKIGNDYLRVCERSRRKIAAEQKAADGHMGERKIRELAKAKGLHLYRGHAHSCAVIHTEDGVREPYSITRPEPREGSDPNMWDSYLVLCRITLAEAEKYLTDGTVPAGHELYELSPYEG